MVPVVPSKAITWLLGVVINMTPLFTTGAASCARPSPVVDDHTSFSRDTFSGVI